MEVCSNGHDEIVYDSRNCPLCEMIEEKDEAEKLVEGLENKVADLEAEIEEIREPLRAAVREVLDVAG